MLYTTVPTLLLTLLIMLWFGFRQTAEALPDVEIALIQTALSASYGLNPLITLLPLLVMILLSVRRVSPQVSMTMSILVAVLIGVFYQGASIPAVMNALWSNSAGTTGIENIDNLLGRGGISSMSWTLLLSIMALALGGILFKTQILEVLLAGLISRVKRTASLIALTLVSGFVGNVAMGEAYISIILNCQLFSDAFKARGLAPSILSRSVEEGSTVTTGLIPWTTAGAFYAVTLGVPVLDYLPYAFFNLLTPLVSVSMAVMGFGLLQHRTSRQPAI